MTALSRAELAALPGHLAAEVLRDTTADLATPGGRDAARSRIASVAARDLLAGTLVRTCRAHGFTHVTTLVAAAHVVARLGLPEPEDGGGAG